MLAPAGFQADDGGDRCFSLPPAFQPVMAVVEAVTAEAVIGGAARRASCAALDVGPVLPPGSDQSVRRAQSEVLDAKLSTPASKPAGTSPAKWKNKSKSPDSVTSPAAERD